MKSINKLFFFLSLFCFLGSNAQTADKTTEQLGYGLKLGINYSLIGASFNNYSGSAMFNGAMFINKKMSDHFTFMFEPGYSGVSFREQSSDKRYNMHNIDAGLTAVFYPSLLSREFSFHFGLRPSYLVTYSSEIIEGGSYITKTFDNNKNRKGNIDVGAFAGISIAMSEFVNLELVYNYSATDRNNATDIKGRPSTIEVGLRLNAVSLKEKMTRKEKSLRDIITGYSRGSLLVMLATPNTGEIEKLKSQGKEQEITLINNEIIARNQKIMRDFRENYTISKVYFFMDTSAYKILSRSFEGVFVNINMQADPVLKPDSSNYFVAAFNEDISTYTNKMHYGLFLFDEKLNPLDKPFNHPGNLVSPVLDGDPLNYLKKRPNYIGVPYYRIIGKFNSRLLKYLD